MNQLAQSSRTAVIRSFGTPAEVIETIAADVPAPGPQEIVVEMRYAPINPADLNLIEGNYGTKPPLPATPGAEGCGMVVATGACVSRVKIGQPVVVFTSGNWRSHRVLRESEVLGLPTGIDLRQAALLKVNPATAWLMLHNFTWLEPHDWVLQNAGNSNVGRCAIQIAKQIGWKTLNVVRRPELFPELEALGADAVLLDDDSVSERVRELSNNAPLRLALNAVGGESALRLASCLAEAGTLVTYGAMSRKALKIPNGFLIFKNLSFRGFWLSRWVETTAIAVRDQMYEQLADWVAGGTLVQAIHQVVPLSQIKDALAEAASSNRPGKVVLDLQS